MLVQGKAPTINGDGTQTRDFTYVSNAVQANLLATEHAERASGRIMNVACGDRISLNELYASLCEHLNVEIDPIHGPPRAGDIQDSLADISVARELLGYDPTIDLHEGLRHTVEFFTT